jgi:hypothetical protein
VVVVTCFTNLGVTCFMLISGYYGIRFNLEKLIKLDMMIIFYSVIKTVIRVALAEEVGAMDILSTIFPILSGQYWYMTAYFVIVFLSSWLNRIPEKLSRQDFRRLLLLLIFFLDIVPTVLHFDIIGKEGKNPIYMILIYLIGRYIRKHCDREYINGRVAKLLLLNLALTMLLELAAFTFTGRYSMFYRDCSIFTLASSILLFTLFRGMYFENRAVNRIASCVLAVYVFSTGFQKLVYLALPLEDYAFSPLLFPLVAVFTVCVVTGCMVCDMIRQSVFKNVEAKLPGFLCTAVRKMIMSSCDVGQWIMEKIEGYIAVK